MKFFYIFFVLLFSISLFAKTDSIPLIKPSGEYPIGTLKYEWENPNRIVKTSSGQIFQRTVITQFWYPGEKSSESIRAPYSAENSDYSLVQTHSYLRLPFNETLDKAPLIIIVPGRGLERFVYSSIAEELASHGFVVASIDMPEIGYLKYSDGFMITASEKFEAPEGMMSGPFEKVDAFYEAPTKLGFQDLEFMLGKIKDLNINDLYCPLKGHMDLENVGIFGHSLGGRIAGEFTWQNSNVKAYASMEGIPPQTVRYEGKIQVPSLMLCSKETWFYAQKNYESFYTNTKSKVYMMRLTDFGHNSLTEGPYLFSKSFKYPINPERALLIGRDLLLQFYLQELIGGGDLKKAINSDIHIQCDIYPGK